MGLNIVLGRAKRQNKKVAGSRFWVVLVQGYNKRGQYWCPTGIGENECFNYLLQYNNVTQNFMAQNHRHFLSHNFCRLGTQTRCNWEHLTQGFSQVVINVMAQAAIISRQSWEGYASKLSHLDGGEASGPSLTRDISSQPHGPLYKATYNMAACFSKSNEWLREETVFM